MVEVNIHNINAQNLQCEPKLSVRNTTGKELVYFGQDEAIYRTINLNNNVWHIDNKTNLWSKGMVSGIMASTFTSFKFGFEYEMTKDKLKQVNSYHSG